MHIYGYTTQRFIYPQECDCKYLMQNGTELEITVYEAFEKYLEMIENKLKERYKNIQLFLDKKKNKVRITICIDVFY
jgi:hypothetical protein